MEMEMKVLCCAVLCCAVLQRELETTGTSFCQIHHTIFQWINPRLLIRRAVQLSEYLGPSTVLWQDLRFLASKQDEAKLRLAAKHPRLLFPLTLSVSLPLSHANRHTLHLSGSSVTCTEPDPCQPEPEPHCMNHAMPASFTTSRVFIAMPGLVSRIAVLFPRQRPRPLPHGVAVGNACGWPR